MLNRSGIEYDERYLWQKTSAAPMGLVVVGRVFQRLRVSLALNSCHWLPCAAAMRLGDRFRIEYQVLALSIK